MSDSAVGRFHATYTFDPRVECLLGRAALLLFACSRAEEVSSEESLGVLLELEALQLTASYTEAGLPADELPLGDPAGRAAVGVMWGAVMDELASEGWEQLVRHSQVPMPNGPTLVS